MCNWICARISRILLFYFWDGEFESKKIFSHGMWLMKILKEENHVDLGWIESKFIFVILQKICINIFTVKKLSCKIVHFSQNFVFLRQLLRFLHIFVWFFWKSLKFLLNIFAKLCLKKCVFFQKNGSVFFIKFHNIFWSYLQNFAHKNVFCTKI